MIGPRFAAGVVLDAGRHEHGESCERDFPFCGPDGRAEACADCGRLSSAACPFDALTCSECSFVRERSVAGRSNVIPDCPAHGAFIPDPEDSPDA